MLPTFLIIHNGELFQALNRSDELLDHWRWLDSFHVLYLVKSFV